MKCPKCGYNSFEHHDTCKKCANDLTAYKATFGLTAIVLPLEARTAMAESFKSETAAADETPAAAEGASDMFSFDLPQGESAGEAAAPAQADNPFNFDEEPATPQSSGLGDFSFDEPAAAPPQGFAGFSPDEPVAEPPSGLGDFSFDEPAAAEPQGLGDFSFDVPAEAPQVPGDLSANEEQQAAQVKAEEDAFASLLGASTEGDADAAPEGAPSGTDVEFDMASFSWDETPAPAAAPEAETKTGDDFDSIFGAPEDAVKK